MDLYKVAYQYLTLGWSVVPISRETKRPIIKWGVYQEETPALEDIKKWFWNKTEQDVGIGVILGEVSNLVALDSDYKKENYAPLKRIKEKLEIDTPLIVNSGGGGHHLYFKYEKPFRKEILTPFKNLNGCVELRGNTHFMVLPPTIHQSGKPYTWGLPSKMDLYTAEYEAPELDQETYNRLMKYADVVSKFQSKDSKFDLTVLDKVDYLGVGQRYNFMAQILGIMIGSKRTKQEAYTILQIINLKCKPQKSKEELQEMITSFYNTYYNAT